MNAWEFILKCWIFMFKRMFTSFSMTPHIQLWSKNPIAQFRTLGGFMGGIWEWILVVIHYLYKPAHPINKNNINRRLYMWVNYFYPLGWGPWVFSTLTLDVKTSQFHATCDLCLPCVWWEIYRSFLIVHIFLLSVFQLCILYFNDDTF